MPVSRALIAGSPYLGVYLKVGESGAVLPPIASASFQREVERLFQVRAIRTTIRDCDILGALLAMNSHGAVVGDELDDKEIRSLEELVSVEFVKTRQNAMGNNVLANDHGALVHPEFGDDVVRRISSALKVPVERGTVAGLGTVGMAAIATNRGVVVHPRATDGERQQIEDLLKVPVHRSTANFGVPVVGACLIANSRAIVTGRPTTPVEIVHLQEGLGIFD
ncbi:MAG: translation initiation factor IF-6 [Thermoplasmata archaeon]